MVELQSQERALHIVLVTGMSGAGKTLALKTLEDMGFFSIDNLPISLMEPLLRLLENNPEVSRAALAMDVRDPGFVSQASEMVQTLRQRGHTVSLLFLDASPEVLVRRFAETRRPHPLARNIPVRDAVEREWEMLTPLRSGADMVVDTTQFTVHTLRQTLQRMLGSPSSPKLSVVVQSFGFKYGVPMDAAYVFDVRFLRNPYFVEAMQDLTGLASEVREYVMADPSASTILGLAFDLLDTALPLLTREGRSMVTVAIGCTGGHHRSVVLSEELGRRLADRGYHVSVVHRDITG